MTIKQMIEEKKRIGLTNQMIADRSGVPLTTVQKIFSGATPSPRYETRMALEKVFEPFKTDFPDFVAEPSSYGSGAKKKFIFDFKDTETHVAYGTTESETDGHRIGHSKGDRTIADYLALPDTVRVELIDGRFYDMGSPTTLHQRIAPIVESIFEQHIEGNRGLCVPFIAPMDVQLDSDDKTIVQPDVLVVCNRSKITRSRIVGAPDLIVEVVSPSNSSVDTILKLHKYKNAGVREYWIIFPDEKKVYTYFFEENDEPMVYTFKDTVPVRIWNGECSVDFAAVYDRISFLYEL